MTTIRGPWTLGTNLTATGSTVDAAGGGGVTGSGTPGYVAVWSSPTNLATSSLYDSGADPRGVILTQGTLTSPDQAGTAGNGVDLTMRAGNGGTVGGGGKLTLATGGAGIPSYGGGDVDIRPGDGTGGAYGGSILGLAGTGSYTAGNGGGSVQFIGGANLGAGKAGSIQLSGGSSTEGDGGDVTIQSGAGSTNSGSGAGGAVTILAEIGAGSVNNGSLTLQVTKGSGGGGFLIINGLPTSGAGLPSNAVFWNGNVLTRVP